jgi:hypothetical protein
MSAPGNEGNLVSQAMINEDKNLHDFKGDDARKIFTGLKLNVSLLPNLYGTVRVIIMN